MTKIIVETTTQPEIDYPCATLTRIDTGSSVDLAMREAATRTLDMKPGTLRYARLPRTRQVIKTVTFVARSQYEPDVTRAYEMQYGKLYHGQELTVTDHHGINSSLPALDEPPAPRIQWFGTAGHKQFGPAPTFEALDERIRTYIVNSQAARVEVQMWPVIDHDKSGWSVRNSMCDGVEVTVEVSEPAPVTYVVFGRVDE